MLCPDLFWSVDRWWVTYCWIDLPGGRRAQVPDTYEPAGSNLSLLDLDGLSPVETTPDLETSARIRRLVRRASGGRLSVEAIVATSKTGIQVTVSWDRFWVDTSLLYRDPICRRVLAATAGAVRRLLDRGGWVDESAWAPGRYGRRPGWRVGKDGRAVRARLWWARAD